jgi:hypothetical protein
MAQELRRWARVANRAVTRGRIRRDAMRTVPPVIRLTACSALVVIVAGGMPAAAQEASPAAGGTAVCDEEPRDIEELIGFYFSPEGTPLATPTMSTVDDESELPTGESVNAETEAEVSAVVAELVACFETGQFARAFSLMTEDLVRQTGPDTSSSNEDTPEEVRALLAAQIAGTPAAGMAGTTELGAVRELRRLEGGRVGGIWTIAGDAAFVVLEEEDGRWLVDEVVDIAEE